MDMDFLDYEIVRGRVVPKVVMIPKPCRAGVGFVDQISFTFRDDWHHNKRLREWGAVGGGLSAPLLSHDEVIEHQVAPAVRRIFGLRLGERRPVGLNFYQMTWTLEGGAGMVSIGGQGGTILVQVTGHGLACALDGWEARLREFAGLASRCVITRVDVAFDDLDGAFSVDEAVEAYREGGFTLRGRPPGVEQRGNWLCPDGRGRTFYVGRRENGKLLRVYEKGKQLGAETSPWVRIELELHNKDRVIPWDILDRPGAYLAGAYSALEWVADRGEVCRIGTLQNVVKITYEALVGHLRRSYGGLLRVMQECEGNFLEVIEKVGEGRRTPARLDFALAPFGSS